MHHHRPQLPPAARVLATSFLSHHPGGRMFVLVLDDNLGELDGNEPFEVLHLDELAIEPAELHTMAACYSVMELATAVKPWLLETLLRRGTPSVLYLDPDIQVFHSLKELSDLAEEHNIVLTPHVTAHASRSENDERDSNSAIWDLQPGLYRSQSRRWALPAKSGCIGYAGSVSSIPVTCASSSAVGRLRARNVRLQDSSRPDLQRGLLEPRSPRPEVQREVL